MWTLRNSGVSWEDISEQLGISEDRARSWYLRWSHQLEQDYRDNWGHHTVRVAMEEDQIHVLTAAPQPALPLPTGEGGTGPAQQAKQRTADPS